MGIVRRLTAIIRRGVLPHVGDLGQVLESRSRRLTRRIDYDLATLRLYLGRDSDKVTR